MNQKIHHRMLWCLLAIYAVAVVMPGPGLALRTIKIGSESASHLMLAWLLFNAGLAIRVSELKVIHHRLKVLVAGLVANVTMPLAYLLLLSAVARVWPEAHETRVILIGLLISAAMPIAGSSTAWAQTSGGSAVISLGLVLASTALSPLVTPFTFMVSSWFSDPEMIEMLSGLKAAGSTTFLIGTVVLPAGLGILVRAGLPEERWARVAPGLKLSNLLNLLALNYSNASASLPSALMDPDWDFLILVAVICALQCALAFGAGWLLAKGLRTSRGERIALMYGLGMTNTGTGLVLATTHLAAYPLVTLPLICGNFLQQIIAGVVGRWLQRPAKPVIA